MFTILTEAAGWEGLLTLFVPLVIIFVIFYFLMIRPEKKRQAQVAAMQGSVQKKDKIITIGGIYGIVDDVKDNIVTIVVASGARMKVEKTAIKVILNREEEAKTEVSAEDKTE